MKKIKIIQLISMPLGIEWEGRLLGLANDGNTYVCNADGKWILYIRNVEVEKAYKIKSCKIES